MVREALVNEGYPAVVFPNGSVIHLSRGSNVNKDMVFQHAGSDYRVSKIVHGFTFSSSDKTYHPTIRRVELQEIEGQING